MISENSLFGFATLFFFENENCIGKKKASPLAEYIILFRSKKERSNNKIDLYFKGGKEHKLKQKAAATTTYNNKVYDSFFSVSYRSSTSNEVKFERRMRE